MSKWFFTALAIALAVYTAWDYRKAANQAGHFAEGERAPFSFNQADIDLIRVERDQDPIELRKDKDGVWKMLKPVEDDVEDAAVMSLVLSLTTQRVRQFDADSAGAVDWAKFGLAPPAATFVAGSGGEEEAIGVAAKNAFDGSFYLRQKDELLIGDTGFAQINARPSQSLRSRELFRERVNVDRIDVELENQKYTALKKSGRWSLIPEPKFPVDEEKLEAWAERVVAYKPADLVKDGVSEQDKRDYLLAVPQAKFRFNGGFEILMGQARGDEVFIAARETIFKAPAPALENLIVRFEYFRSGARAFDFPVEQAGVIEIKDGKNQYRFTKSGSDWSDPRAVPFMQELRTFQVKGFPTEKKTGIASPRVLVKNDKGELLFSLAWGDDIKGRAQKYARTNLETDLIALDKNKLDALMKTLENP